MGSIGTSSDPISGFRGTTRYITTHNKAGEAVVHSAELGQWQPMRDNSVAMNLIYTTSDFPAVLNDNQDIEAHEKKVSTNNVGLVSGGGSVCRMVDFAPGNSPMMHRTKSLDYGVVLEGQVEMVLDSGEVHLLKKGDVAVQRGTMHAWRNPSQTEWARMMFVLLDCQPLQVGGESLREALAPEQHEIPPSNNDG